MGKKKWGKKVNGWSAGKVSEGRRGKTSKGGRDGGRGKESKVKKS